MADLDTLVQALPPELYNRIYDFTFTINTSESECVVSLDYEPPACLQVSQSSRKKFSRSFYNKTICYIDDFNLCSWLRSLEERYIYQIREIRITQSRGPLDEGAMEPDSNANSDAGAVFRSMYDELLYFDLSAAAASLRLRIRCSDTGKVEWIASEDVAVECG